MSERNFDAIQNAVPFFGISEGPRQSEDEFNAEIVRLQEEEALAEAEAQQKAFARVRDDFAPAGETKAWWEYVEAAKKAVEEGRDKPKSLLHLQLEELGLDPKFKLSRFGTDYLNKETGKRDFFMSFSGRHLGIERAMALDEKKIALGCQLLADKGNLKKPHITEPTPASFEDSAKFYTYCIKGLLAANPAFDVNKITLENPKFQYILDEFKNVPKAQLGGIGEPIVGYDAQPEAAASTTPAATSTLVGPELDYREALVNLRNSAVLAEKNLKPLGKLYRENEALRFINYREAGDNPWFNRHAKGGLDAYRELQTHALAFVEAVAGFDPKPEGAADLAKVAKGFISATRSQPHLDSLEAWAEQKTGGTAKVRKLLEDVTVLTHHVGQVADPLLKADVKGRYSLIDQKAAAFGQLKDAIRQRDGAALSVRKVDADVVNGLAKRNVCDTDDFVYQVSLKGQGIDLYVFEDLSGKARAVRRFGSGFGKAEDATVDVQAVRALQVAQANRKSPLADPVKVKVDDRDMSSVDVEAEIERYETQRKAEAQAEPRQEQKKTTKLKI